MTLFLILLETGKPASLVFKSLLILSCSLRWRELQRILANPSVSCICEASFLHSFTGIEGVEEGSEYD